MLPKKVQLLLVFITWTLGLLLTSMGFALLGPLLPKEAELKHVTPTQYGLVFGVYSLVVIIMSLTFGKYLTYFGATFLTWTGLLLSGGTLILFGILHYMGTSKQFLVFAFVIRIVSGIGDTAFSIPMFSMILKIFPDRAGSLFSVLSSFYTLGFILGPIFGKALASLDGFPLPFTVVGSCLLFLSIVAYLSFPPDSDSETHLSGSFLRILRNKSATIKILGSTCSAFSLGLIFVGFEPHLRQFNLSPVLVGILYTGNNIVYSPVAPIWGLLIDKGLLTPNRVLIFATIFMTLALLLIGPAPFFSCEPNLSLIIPALILLGTGNSGQYIASYIGVQREATLDGMPANVTTFSTAAGLWNVSLGFGLFVGTSLSGYLVDAIGFRASSLLMAALHFILLCVFVICEFCVRKTIVSDGCNEHSRLADFYLSSQESL